MITNVLMSLTFSTGIKGRIARKKIYHLGERFVKLFLICDTSWALGIYGDI